MVPPNALTELLEGARWFQWAVGHFHGAKPWGATGATWSQGKHQCGHSRRQVPKSQSYPNRSHFGSRLNHFWFLWQISAASIAMTRLWHLFMLAVLSVAHGISLGLRMAVNMGKGLKGLRANGGEQFCVFAFDLGARELFPKPNEVKRANCCRCAQSEMALTKDMGCCFLWDDRSQSHGLGLRLWDIQSRAESQKAVHLFLLDSMRLRRRVWHVRRKSGKEHSAAAQVFQAGGGLY